MAVIEPSLGGCQRLASSFFRIMRLRGRELASAAWQAGAREMTVKPPNDLPRWISHDRGLWKFQELFAERIERPHDG
ncbi:hypothetical protein DC522_24260 [Microvirga sp. KLBC 81]|nr:hypothetical protein DC522_24260 [Microvirga sp. KLBC 81]